MVFAGSCSSSTGTCELPPPYWQGAEDRPRLYFVKMDIKAAFDTIKQDSVLRVIDTLLEQDWGYALVQYCLLLPPASEASQGSSRRLFKTRAVIEGESSDGWCS